MKNPRKIQKGSESMNEKDEKKAPSRVGGSMPSRWLIVRGKSDIPQNIDRENHIKVIRRK